MTAPLAREEVSAGGIVVRRTPEGDRVLLIRDSYRNWGFPKGHVEPGELPAEAALREVMEETGLIGLAVRADLGPIDWRFRWRGQPVHKVCHFFLMQTESADTSPLHAEGITACRWAPFDETEQLLAYENARRVLRSAREIVISSEAPRSGAESRDLMSVDPGRRSA